MHCKLLWTYRISMHWFHQILILNHINGFNLLSYTKLNFVVDISQVHNSYSNRSLVLLKYYTWLSVFFLSKGGPLSKICDLIEFYGYVIKTHVVHFYFCNFYPHFPAMLPWYNISNLLPICFSTLVKTEIFGYWLLNHSM